jgi:hypothetical protein
MKVTLAQAILGTVIGVAIWLTFWGDLKPISIAGMWFSLGCWVEVELSRL